MTDRLQDRFAGLGTAVMTFDDCTTEADARSAWTAYMLSMGVVATEAEAHELIDKCAAAGVDPQAVADVIWRWKARTQLANAGQLSEQLHRAAIERVRRVPGAAPPKPKRADRRRSRQARSSRPRALQRAIARGLDPELAKREHLAHGGKGEP